MSLTRPLEAVIAAARAAGALIQDVHARGFDVHHKGSAGPVTEADRGADALLQERLLAIEDVAWLSEETADDRARLTAERVWIVDPLDGTKEFVKGLPEYAVAVALVERGEPILAVVHNPATGETFWAEKGGGAFTGDGERLTVSDSSTLLASRSEIERGELESFQEGWTLEPIGSIEYKLALVAEGRGAVTLSRGPKHEWDVAAGALIVQEAGGVATDLFGAPLRFNRPFPKVKGILAGAPAAYERVRRRVVDIGASDRMAELG